MKAPVLNCKYGQATERTGERWWDGLHILHRTLSWGKFKMTGGWRVFLPGRWLSSFVYSCYRWRGSTEEQNFVTKYTNSNWITAENFASHMQFVKVRINCQLYLPEIGLGNSRSMHPWGLEGTCRCDFEWYRWFLLWHLSSTLLSSCYELSSSAPHSFLPWCFCLRTNWPWTEFPEIMSQI